MRLLFCMYGPILRKSVKKYPFLFVQKSADVSVSSSFNVFINVFSFLYVRLNSQEICREEISFPFFQRSADVSVSSRFKANYLEKKRGYPWFSLWIPIALAKIYFLRMVLIWRRNLLYLVGTVLNAKKHFLLNCKIVEMGEQLPFFC